MNYYIGCDAHKKYSVFTSVSEEGEKTPAIRINHSREEFQAYLKTLPSGSAIAVETIGSWYWMVDETKESRTQTISYPCWES